MADRSYPGSRIIRIAVDVYLESGRTRVFASAADWPGWSRSGRTDTDALTALVGYGPRYAAAIGPGWGLTPPTDIGALVVVERLEGGSGTDFGAPSRAASSEERPVSTAELGRLTGLLAASWAAFDAAAEAAAGHALRTGPRGGGRDRDTIISHVLEAEEAYLVRIGGSLRDAAPRATGVGARMGSIRSLVLATLADRAGGVAMPDNPRRTGTMWSVRYFVRRSAWHALDHAWEIEDRVG